MTNFIRDHNTQPLTRLKIERKNKTPLMRKVYISPKLNGSNIFASFQFQGLHVDFPYSKDQSLLESLVATGRFA